MGVVIMLNLYTYPHPQSHPISAPALVNRSLTIRIATYDDLAVDGLVGTSVSAPYLFELALRVLQKILVSIDFLLRHEDIFYADDTPMIVLDRMMMHKIISRTMTTNIISTRFYMTNVRNHGINCTNFPNSMKNVHPLNKIKYPVIIVFICKLNNHRVISTHGLHSNIFKIVTVFYESPMKYFIEKH